jgi:hypothetical protein
MCFQSKLKALLVIIMSLCAFSCASTKVSDSVDCQAGQQCVLTGLLSIKRSAIASVGVLEVDGGCVSIALPNDVTNNKSRWDNKKVTVEGDAYVHAAATGVISYTLVDREVLVGACDRDKVLYLKKISRS